jgi:hypothetical protein
MLCGEVGHECPRCGCNILLTLRGNHEEDTLPGLREDLPAFLGRDQRNITRWDYLRYPVQFLVQIKNNSAKPRIIYNMKFP